MDDPATKLTLDRSHCIRRAPVDQVTHRVYLSKFVHIFGKGAGARGSDGGECGKQL